jgi:hypothetical protein
MMRMVTIDTGGFLQLPRFRQVTTERPALVISVGHRPRSISRPGTVALSMHSGTDSNGTKPVLVPESKTIPGNRWLSVAICAGALPIRFRRSRVVEPQTRTRPARRCPASHPGGRRFESG